MQIEISNSNDQNFNGEKVSKKNHISTDLFKEKNVPDFIKNHSLFKTPTKVQKVFPSVGLPNFKDKANIDKCFVDIKKEGSYVHNLLRTMTEILVRSRDIIIGQADRFQYLDTKEARDQNRAKLNSFYSLSSIMTNIAECTDPYTKDVLDNTIKFSDGKITLRLIKDITGIDGKIIFRKEKTLFSIFNNIKEQCAAVNIDLAPLEQTDAFKVFSNENIPNKEFSVVFSSEGSEGAWDLITMSMRGITSCQRWEGEYPGCLIGSVFSKFVGIMYLTSGVMSTGDDKNGNRSNLGTKMMRRCVVRYAIDADESKPCILIDKMYPELDKDVLSVFVNAIKTKTELPVYYAQELVGNKLRHIYMPAEKLGETILNRELSYQDTPLKSKQDLNVIMLNKNKEELEREIKGFKINLALFLARRLEDIYSNNIQISDKDIIIATNNIRMNASYTPFCEEIVSAIIANFRSPSSAGMGSSKAYYKKYMMEFLIKRKQTLAQCKTGLIEFVNGNTSRVIDTNKFIDYIFSIIIEFTKLEISKQIN